MPIIIDLRATERCRIPHNGKSDSLLLAEYGRTYAGEI